MQCESGRYWPRDAAEPSLKLSRIPNSCFISDSVERKRG